MNGRDDEGFTMVEVLAALAVIGTVLAAVTTFFVHSMVTVEIHNSRQVAIRMAGDGMEQLRTRTGAEARTWLEQRSAATPEEVTMGAPDSPIYLRSWTWRDSDSAVPGLIDATVQVRWRQRGCEGFFSYQASTSVSTVSAEPVFEATS